MKTLTLIMLTVLTGSIASASDTNLLLSKTLSSGFSPEQYRVSGRCKIYADRVEVTKSAGSIATSQVKKITMTGDLQALISQAANGKITSEVAPTDGPVTSYQAFTTGGNVALPPVTLKSLGSSRLSNDAPAAITLINLIDQLCF